jgi:Cupin domain
MKMPEITYHRESDIPGIHKGVRGGEDAYNQHFITHFDAERGIGCRVESVQLNPTFIAPRHRHVYDQIRYILDGELEYDGRRHGPGDFLYVPESTWYGPQGGQTAKLVDIQFTGPGGVPYIDQDALGRARKEMSEVGTFEAGIYTDAEGRTQDSYVALSEYITGKPLEYPTARYDDYVAVHSSAFPWVESSIHDGVALRHLATFNETGPEAIMLKLEAGAELPPAAIPFQQARFILDGAVEYAGGEYSGISFAYIPPDAKFEATRVAIETTMLVITWSYAGGPAISSTPGF